MLRHLLTRKYFFVERIKHLISEQTVFEIREEVVRSAYWPAMMRIKKTNPPSLFKNLLSLILQEKGKFHEAKSIIL